jgi:eukaryotic-like serine/threonine-protein kinase
MITWIKRLLQRGSATATAAQAHITFGATSVGRSISRTSLVLRKQLWIWPIIALAILATIGYGLRAAIERTMRQNLQSQLETLLNVERSMLETWLKVQESNAESLANAPHVREITSQLLMANSISPGVIESTPPNAPTTQHAAPPAPHYTVHWLKKSPLECRLMIL